MWSFHVDVARAACAARARTAHETFCLVTFSFPLPSWFPIHKRHKLVKTAGWNKEGFFVVDEYEFGHLESESICQQKKEG